LATIHISREGLRHAVARHTVNRFTKYAAKSKFNPDVDLIELIRLASGQEAVVQADGKQVYSFDAGRIIGREQHGGATSIVTVITRADGVLITLFPGRP
jgi:hypothetical protein